MPAGMRTSSSKASWAASWEESVPAGSHGPLRCCGHMTLVIPKQSGLYGLQEGHSDLSPCTLAVMWYSHVVHL